MDILEPKVVAVGESGMGEIYLTLDLAVHISYYGSTISDFVLIDLTLFPRKFLGSTQGVQARLAKHNKSCCFKDENDPDLLKV